MRVSVPSADERMFVQCLEPGPVPTVANVQQIRSRSLRRLRAELEHGGRKRRRILPVENEGARG